MEDVSNISSIEEMTIQIQEDLIKLIKENVESSKIRFWEKDERLDEDTIFEMYEDIYNVYVFYSYKKNSKRPQIQSAISKNFNGVSVRWYNAFYLKLDNDTISSLTHWCKLAASTINRYLQDRFSYYLREVRFDLLPNEDRTNFIIPNLPLANVRFSTTPKGQDRVAAEYFAELNLNDLKAVQDFFSMRNKNSD